MKKLIYFCIYLCLLSMLVSCGKSTEQKIQEQLELGQKYLLEQKYEEAVIAFQMVLELDPKNINGYLSLSDVYMEMDSPDLAAQTLKTGIDAYDADDETDGLNQLKERLVKCRRRQIDSELDDGNYDNAAELYEEMNSYGADEEVLTALIDGEAFGKQLGNTPENQRTGGRKLLVGNRELFLLSGRLYYEENDELKEFINDQNYRLDSLNLSGNWIYGLGYFEGMPSTKSPDNYLSARLIRYNILTKKWEYLGMVTGESLYGNSSILINGPSIYYIKRWETAAGYPGQLWKMNLLGKEQEQISSWQQIIGKIYIENDTFYYQEGADYEDAPELLNYSLLSGRYGWQQHFCMDLSGSGIRQLTKITNAAEVMKPLISGEKSYFEEPLIGGGIAGIGPRITYGGNTYLLAGNTLFQADEDGDNYHVIKAYKMHISGCEYPVTGWEGVPSEFATLDYSEMLSFYQDGNILILAKARYEDGIPVRYTDCDLFDMEKMEFINDSNYQAAVMEIMPNMGDVIFTPNYIYVNEIHGNQSDYVRINKKTGKKEDLSAVIGTRN